MKKLFKMGVAIAALGGIGYLAYKSLKKMIDDTDSKCYCNNKECDGSCGFYEHDCETCECRLRALRNEETDNVGEASTEAVYDDNTKVVDTVVGDNNVANQGNVEPVSDVTDNIKDIPEENNEK